MVYSKSDEDEIFNNLYDNYFIKTESDADICHTEDIKNVYRLYIDKKNIGINSFIAFLINKGCIRLKGGLWKKLLIKTDVLETIVETNNKKLLLDQVRHKINELHMIESKLIMEIMMIKNETNKCANDNIELDFTKKNVYTITYADPELVQKIDCTESKVHHLSELFINLIELCCSKCLTIQPDLDLSIYTRLERLDVSKSSINKLFIMPNLIYLKCNNTDICSLPLMPKLEFVNINDTHIEHLDETMNNIKELYCSNTLITCIPSTYTKLNVLHCDNLYIDSVSPSFKDLIEISISYTNIVNIPKTFTKLKILKCNDTNITNLPIELDQLEYIDVHNVPRYDDDITWDIINNAIDHIPECFTKIKTLICTNTKIQQKIDNLIT